MNTILTDDERPKLPELGPEWTDYWRKTVEQKMEAYADAREAAVLAKLAQQADRQRVPDEWRETLVAAQKALHRATLPMANSADMQKIHAALHQANALLAAALEAPAFALPKDTTATSSYTNPAPPQTEQTAVQTCTDERPCIPCFTDNGLCAAPTTAAPEAPAQASAVDERAAFEEWIQSEVSGEWIDLSPMNGANGRSYSTFATYRNKYVEALWSAWQARAALAQKGGAA